MSYWENQLPMIPSNEAVCAAEEQRCVCIIQDLTSDTSKKHTHTLPISTITDNLFEIVAKKLKYVKSTFSLSFSKSSYVAEKTVTRDIPLSTTQTLGDCGLSSEGKTHIQVGMKNGKKPTPSHEAAIKEDSGDEASTSSTGWSYSNEWSTNSGPSPPPAPPVPPKIGQNGQRRNAVSQDASTSFADSISAAASKIKGEEFKSVDDRGSRLLGLVNQAMTCYLNSLIQTLYMTPEFRNALYEWEYKGNEEEAANTIPFQLQRLFLALQTSDKLSIETTDLTKSFGWDSSEAWQQHDIQELCRVMFDALEQKFKESIASETENTDKSDDEAVKSNTENENGIEKKCTSEKKTQEPEIIKLYEGTMKDYVQCEECKNETSRNDTYLDIPITIRPFGSTVTYKSVMEGLKAFVEPEILDETNQYFCEKCNKKCDAKKGLKFTSFPYLLTLQLKRFDFDYSTMHRVKLNDKMYFPQELDLNSFIEQEDEKDSTKESLSDQASDCAAEDQSEIELQIVEEEARSEGSSRDSGNDDDRPSHTGSRRTALHVSDDISEEGSSVDEGIDIESQSGFNGASGNNGTEDGLGSGGSTPGAIGGVPKNQIWADLHGTTKPKGKYLYELFSIMIHSGSAVGGHYYAYIKSFDDGQWYSFNDQIVSPISQSDIEKSYGGSGARSTYSSSFSSSTNAYMLMYRQIDPGRNKGFITTEQLPEHIKQLAVQEEEREKQMREQKEKEKSMCNIKVYCRDPALMKKHSLSIMDISYDFHNSLSLENATTEVYKLLGLGEVGVERKNCRLVKYDNFHQSLEQSLDDEEEYQQLPLAKLLGSPMMSSYLFELLMETKQSHQQFQVYKPGGVTVKVFPADYSTGCFLDHVTVRLMPEDSIYHLKQVLAKVLHYPLRRIRMAYEKYTSDVQLLTSAMQTLKDIGFSRTIKIYVDLMNDEEYAEWVKRNATDIDRAFAPDDRELLKQTRLWTLIDRASNLINVQLILPEDAPTYELPISRPLSPVNLESPSSETDSIPPLISISPPSELKTCPEAPPGSVRTTPSSDEGLGGSCDGGSAPKTAEGSQSASPKERAQPVECQGMLAATMSSSAVQTENSFWDLPEQDNMNDNQPYAVLRNIEGQLNRDDELPASQHLRRNSEEDEGCLTGSPRNFTFSTADFKEELNERLMLAAYDRASPTSSLKCEDGSISESGSQTSGEFELQDQIRQQGDGAADSAGSCSTIDSTGTLCNTTDTSGFKIEDETLPIYSYSQERENCAYMALPTATKMSALPGVNRVVNDDGYAKIGGEIINPPDYYDGRIEKDVNSITETKAESSSSFCDCAMDYSADSSNSQDTGRSYLCCNCGNIKQGCMTNKNFDLDATSKTPNDSATDGSVPNERQDPESGEDIDMSPLFAEIGAGEPKCIEMTCLNNPSLAPETNRHGGGEPKTTPLEQYAFFRVYSVYSNDQKCQVLKARLDKRTTVKELKQLVFPIVQISTEDFSIYRVFQNGHETELNCMNEKFSLIPDEAKLRVKHQRALREDEYRCKVFLLNLTDESNGKPSIDWVVKKCLKIEDAKQTISEKIEKELGLTIKPDHIRLRKKCWQNPGRIYLNGDKFENDAEIFIQMLEKPEQKMTHDESSIFCRRWNPSTLTIGPFQEVILNMDNKKYYPVGHLEEKLAEISDIEAGDIEWAKLRGLFPCATSVLEIHDGLEWRQSYKANVHCSSANINEEGTILVFRDKNELIKELTESEKSELAKKEETRLAAAKNFSGSRNSSSTIRPYSRKERPLKIYTAGKKKKETTAL